MTEVISSFVHLFPNSIFFGFQLLITDQEGL